MSDENGKTNALAAAETAIPAAIEAALLEGDVQCLKPEERTAYYRAICESVGLNWLTRPLDLLKGQDGKYRFYFRKEATDQLARASQISFTTLHRERIEDLYIVEVRGTLPGGRSLDDQGIVPYPEKAAPTDRANAMMKATTKARRRVTLGLVGLGWQVADEDQRGAVVDFSLETGALIVEESGAEDHAGLLFGDHAAADAARQVEHYVPPSKAPEEGLGRSSVKLYEDRAQESPSATPPPVQAPPTPPVKSVQDIRQAAGALVIDAAVKCQASPTDIWGNIQALVPKKFELRRQQDLETVELLLPRAVAAWVETHPPEEHEDDISWMPEAEILAWIAKEALWRKVEQKTLQGILDAQAEGWDTTLGGYSLEEVAGFKVWAANIWKEAEKALTAGC